MILVLTIVMLSGSAQSSLPKVSYIKALDVWLISCFIFILATLITIALLNFLYGDGLLDNGDNKETKSRSRGESNHGDLMVKINLTEDVKEEQKAKDAEAERNIEDIEEPKMTSSMKRMKALYVARCAIPFTFAVFNVVYWCYYLIPFIKNEY